MGKSEQNPASEAAKKESFFGWAVKPLAVSIKWANRKWVLMPLGGLLALVAFKYEDQSKEVLSNWGLPPDLYGFGILLLRLGVAIIAFGMVYLVGAAVVYFVKKYKIVPKDTVSEDLNSLPKSKEKHTRFEDIKNIRVGYVVFSPTLLLSNTGEPEGPGREIIDAIFGGHVTYCAETSWDKMLDEMNKDHYDLLATPVYDTPDRRVDALMSLPLYYANMGIYVNKGSPLIPDIDGQHEFTFQQLKGYLSSSHSKIKGMQIAVNAGELNEKVVCRHFKSLEVLEVNGHFNVRSALTELSENRNNRHLVICERWLAEQHSEFGKGYINILKEKELLYPVVFMMKKSEETLRKLINLRLLDLQDRIKDPDGKLVSVKDCKPEIVFCFERGLLDTKGKSGSQDLLANASEYFYRGSGTKDRFFDDPPPDEPSSGSLRLVR